MAEKLHLAFLAPLKRPVAASTTASRPHLLYELIRGLIKNGHKITLFASGDSLVEGAEIIPVIPRSLSSLPPVENPFYQHTAALTFLLYFLKEKGKSFDLIHNHLYPEFLPLLFAQEVSVPILTTIHAQMTPDLAGVLKLFPEAPLVAISFSQAKLAPESKFTVIYNGVDLDFFRFQAKNEGDFFLFLGRLSGAKDKDGRYLDPKGVLTALKVAKETGEKLLFSGNVEEKAFFEKEVSPFLSEKIQFLGPVSSEQPLPREKVVSLMQKAKALLFPINWDEPFGLVMVEAQACGTPVIAYARGSVPEIVKDGETGFLVSPFKDAPSPFLIKETGLKGLVAAVNRLNHLSPEQYQKMREACREHVEKHFTLEKMVENYERIYYQLREKKRQ